MNVVLIAMDIVVALTAIGGGIALVLDVDRRVNPVWLEGTPCTSYRLPGVALAGIVGGSALVAAIVLLLDSTVGAGLSVIAGSILAVWIAVEVVVLNQPDAPTRIERLYFVLGLAMVVLGLGIAIG